MSATHEPVSRVLSVGLPTAASVRSRVAGLSTGSYGDELCDFLAEAIRQVLSGLDGSGSAFGIGVLFAIRDPCLQIGAPQANDKMIFDRDSAT